jgi:hydrogenase maturation factor
MESPWVVMEVCGSEGKFVAFVDPERAAAVLAAMREMPEGRDAALIETTARIG